MNRRKLRRFHRINAYILLIFISLHLFNHLVGLWGVRQHVLIMDWLRSAYRMTPVELVVFLLFFSQILLGITLVVMRGWPRNPWSRMQIISGVVLGLFLLQHLGAVVLMRFQYADLDTNLFWAASVVQAKPLGWYFFPYYMLGLFSLFAHIGAFMKLRDPQSHWPLGLIGLGAIFSMAIPAMLLGMFFPIELPEAYQLYLKDFYPAWLVTNL